MSAAVLAAVHWTLRMLHPQGECIKACTHIKTCARIKTCTRIKACTHIKTCTRGMSALKPFPHWNLNGMPGRCAGGASAAVRMYALYMEQAALAMWSDAILTSPGP